MKVFYDERYTAAEYDFDTTRKSAVVAAAVAGMENVELVSPRAVTSRELGLVHDPKYVRSVRTGKGPSRGAFFWDPGLWTAVSTSTGGAVDAALTALEEGISGSLSSGLHHARSTGGAGFCTFNGLALAAKMALGDRPRGFRNRKRAHKCKRVLILDMDAHCGGGTHSLIKDDPRIWQIDISVCFFDSYKSKSERHHLHILTDPSDYLGILEVELERAAEIGFDLVIYNAGMDPHEDCGIGGLNGISSEVLRLRDKFVFDWAREQGIPIAFVLAGGYTGRFMWEERLAALHATTIAVAAGAPLPDLEAIEADPPTVKTIFELCEQRWLEVLDEVEASELPWEEELERELLNDLGLYAEPWDEYMEEEDDGSYVPEGTRVYNSIHELPQDFFEIENEELREQYPEFFH